MNSMIVNVFRSIAVIAMLVAFSGSADAQNPPNHEIGIRLTGLDDFDFIYKKEKSENQYFRHRVGLFDLGVAGSSNRSVWSVGVGYAFGIENRKRINDKLNFIHGFEPRISGEYSSAEGETIGWGVQVGLGYVLGFQYDFAESFYINVETIPAVTFRRQSKGGDNKSYNVNAGFNSNAVAITLAYRFGTGKMN